MTDGYVQNVLNRLEGVKPQGEDRWLARCPSHPDRHPSLDVRLGREGRILLKCWSGCKKEDVLAALRLTWSDLFPPRHGRRGRR